MSQLKSDNSNDTHDCTRVHDDDLDAEIEPSGESMYNNGKGITVSMAFTPLLPPPATGEKRRKNAKSQPINRALFIHEDLTLENLLDTTFEQYDVSDKMMYDLDHPYIGQDDKCSIQRQWPTVPRLVERRHINMMTTLLSSESSELKNTSGAEAKARDDEELVRVQGQGQERSDIGPENLHHSDVQKHARKQ
ncbi:hypothetical protein EV424DRAFT_1536129 [Suillus variegatus]|nr:hypothetical protein EV424DRAFT_1536129 [Suillus variegatus]